MDRRHFLRRLGAAGLMAAGLPHLAWAEDGGLDAAPSASDKLAAAWQRGVGYQVGVLQAGGDATLSVVAAIDVPTRAHALLALPDGDLIAVARRPGDWLLRWTSDGQARAWKWIEPGRAFTGHAVVKGERLYIAETDLESGAGLIGVRDARTLEKIDEWSTHGIDPHQILFDAEGHLMVANGGVPTRPETGRAKVDLARMDSSLVRLHGNTGVRLAQWRLDDPRLSLRHLAWNGAKLGIALQAEHDDPAAMAAAPVFALLENERLAVVETPPLAGYAGSIAAIEEGFAVSCTRAGCIALFGQEGFRQRIDLAEACPLTAVQGRLWAGGVSGVLALHASGRWRQAGRVEGIRLDNHWLSV